MKELKRKNWQLMSTFLLCSIALNLLARRPNIYSSRKSSKRQYELVNRKKNWHLDFVATIEYVISMNVSPSILQSSKTKYLSFYLRWRWSPGDIDVKLLRCVKSHWRFDETLRAVGRYLHDTATRRHTCKYQINYTVFPQIMDGYSRETINWATRWF